MPNTDTPTLELHGGVATLTFPGDDYVLDFRSYARDKFDRLMVRVTARHAAMLLHTARIDILNQQAQEAFAARCRAVNSTVADWQSRLQSAIPGLEQLAEVPQQPAPLRRELSHAEPFPLEALGSVLSQMAGILRKVVQAPDAICGQSVLAAGATAVQSAADVLIDGRKFPCSAFFLTIGETGERKTATDQYALWPHYRHERSLTEHYKTAMADYLIQVDVYRKAREEALKSAKGRASKQAAVEALGLPPRPPWEPTLLIQEPTYEGLIKTFLKGYPSIGLFADEGGRLIGGHAMNADNILKTAAGLSELWDGKRITRVRASDETAILYDRRLSLHLMVQPVVAATVLSNRLLQGQGFLSRCLTCWPGTTAGTRAYQAVNLAQESAVLTYNARMQKILDALLPWHEDPEVVQECTPRPMPLAPRAKRLWETFHNHVEAQLADGKELAPIRGFANKAAEHAARLAAIVTLVEDHEASTIGTIAIEAGITLAEFYLSEALRLCDTDGADPALVTAEATLAWLQQYEVVHLAQVYQFGPNAVRDAKTARRILTVLEEHGWLRRLDGGAEIDGTHRREAWRVSR
jgi:hypothetical protein